MKQKSLFKQFFLLVLLLVGSATGAWADDIWVKTNFSDLKTGDIVVIVDQTTARAMSNDKGTSNAPTAIAVTLNNDKSEITSTVADNIQWTVTKTDGGLQFGVGTKHLYCINSNNGVRVGTNTNNVFSWKLSDNDDSSENFLFHNATSRYLGVYNSSDWRCYGNVNANIKETVTAIYKKTSAVDPTTPSATLDKTSLDFGKVNFGTTRELTFTVTPANLTGNLDISCNNSKYEVTPISIAQATTTAQTITVTAKPTALNDNMVGTVTISGGGLAASKTVTLSTTVTDPNANDGSEDKPFTVAEAIENTPASGTSENYYIKGIVSGFYGDDIVSDGTNYRYYISDDGTTKDQLLVYKGKGLNEVAFSSADDLLIGDQVVIRGKLTTFSNAPEIAAGNHITSLVRKEVSSIALSGTYTTEFVEGSEFNHDGIVVTATYSDETKEDVTAKADFSEPDMSQIGVQTITVTYKGKTATYDINVTAAPSYTITYYVRGKEFSVNRKQNVELNLETPENINKYMKFLGWSESEDVSGTPVFVANNTPVTTDMILYAIFGKGSSTYNKVTSTGDITDGEYLIVNEVASVAFDGSLETLDAENDVIEVTINEGVIESTDATDAATFTIDTTAGTLQSASGKYIGVSSNSNGLKQTDDAETYTNTFSIDDENNAVISAVFVGSTMSLRYNKAANQNRFRYYKNAGQEAIQLYKKFIGIVEYSLGEDEEICVSSAEWATATTPDYAVDFTGDAKVYIATNVDSNIKLEQINDAPAGTAIVVNAPAGSYTMKKKATATTNVEENKLVSSNSVTAQEGDYALGLYSDGVTIGFGKLDATGAAKMTDGKAFIPATALANAVEFLPFVIGDEESETTSINSIKNSELRIENYDYFNLSGQRVGKDYKGIVVVNGKKVIRK